MLTQLKNRGVEDILIACMDGLSGFPDALRAIYPQTRIQLCIVHMVRNSTKFVSWKGLKKLCADLKTIYSANTEEAEQSWQRHCNDLSEFFKYPSGIRKAIYTTNAIESLNFSLRKVIKNKLIFVNDDANIQDTVFGNSKRKREMDYADKGLGAGVKPVCH